MSYTQVQPKNDMKAGIVRLIVLAFMIVNQALTTFGYNPLPFSNEEVYEGVSVMATGVFAFYAYYKNNNISKESQEAQAVLEAKKSAKKSAKK